SGRSAFRRSKRREGTTMAASSPAGFADLLQHAVTEPGIISSAYRQFHSYSIGNQLLAWAQCIERNIQPGPIATFMNWKEKGRHVRKGEKAIVLCMPVTVKRTIEREDCTDDEARSRGSSTSRIGSCSPRRKAPS